MPSLPPPRRSPPSASVELIACPECAAPASVVRGFGMSCVEHVRVWCADGHWFLMPDEMLDYLVGL